VPTSAEINRPHVVFITIDANQGLRAKKRRFRKCSDVPCKRPILGRSLRLVSLGRTRLPDCPAGSPLADAQGVLDVTNGSPLPGRAQVGDVTSPSFPQVPL
jgi:hypothetical protein